MWSIFKSIHQFFMKLFSFKYVINRNSSEIHKLSNLKPNCHIELMTNKMYVKDSEPWLKNGFNGCRWCYSDEDTDVK